MLPRARAAAERAIEIDPELPAAHLARALTLPYHDSAFPEARAALEEALRLNPSYVDAHRWSEFYWTYVEADYEQAVGALALARRLDPLDRRLDIREAAVEFLFGNFERAEALAKAVLERDPELHVARITLIHTYIRWGRARDAMEVASQIPLGGDAPDVLFGVTALVFAMGGDAEKARARLETLESRHRDGHALPFWRAMIRAGPGEPDAAFALFDEAVADRDGGLLYLGFVPVNAGLQDDPRFAGLMRRVGLGHLVGRPRAERAPGGAPRPKS